MKKESVLMFSLRKMVTISVVYVLTIIVSHAQEYDFHKLRANVTNSQNTNITNVTVMDNWIASQNANGSWSDVAYGKLTISVSIYDNHLFRLKSLAAACTKVGHEKYNNTNYKEAIKKGLQFWFDSKTVDPNWWFNKIYFPQYLGEILIFMRAFDGFIPQTSVAGIDEPEILSLFKPTTINDMTSHSTGANAIDIGMHYVYRGLLTEDPKLLEDTKNKLESVLADNIKSDMIYQDHGAQIMVASYGVVFCDGLMRLASYLVNSPAAFNTKGENFTKVLRFIRNTQAASIRGRSWDFSTLGRGISRNDGLYAYMGYLQKLADDIDPINATEYLDILSRLKGDHLPNYKVPEFNKHYWVSDYTQHARSGYLFTVRNTSTRTVEAESGNGENLKANYLSYGANFISVDGDEYTNIMPVWDWSMIPGTTFPYIETFPERTNWGFNYGRTNFVGGVSDGVHGAAVLNLDEAGIQAKKSWFFFNEEIVCLGVGITDNSNRNVRTTINQAWMKVPSYYCKVGSVLETMQSVRDSTYHNTSLKYIRNGNIGYYFPNQGHVKYTMKQQSGSWHTINGLEGSSDIETGNVFSLWVDHGNNPNNANYSYIVVPGINSEQKAQNHDVSTIKILENSCDKQAVYHHALDVLQVVFHQAGTMTFSGKSVSVNKPCVLMVKNSTIVTLSNPSQSYSSILVTIKLNDTKYTKVVELPTGKEKKGASVTIDFQI